MEMLVVIAFGVVILLVPLGLCIAVAACIWPKADQRAGELLRAILTPEEYRQLIRQGYIDITSPGDPGRVYRVPRFAGRVQVREKGRATMWLCLQPLGWVPDADIVVIHKLMIEANEEAYLQTANLRTASYV